MAKRVESTVIKVVSVEVPVTLGKTLEIVETAFQKFRANKDFMQSYIIKFSLFK